MIQNYRLEKRIEMRVLNTSTDNYQFTVRSNSVIRPVGFVLQVSSYL